jgi:hypothetical protein
LCPQQSQDPSELFQAIFDAAEKNDCATAFDSFQKTFDEMTQETTRFYESVISESKNNSEATTGTPRSSVHAIEFESSLKPEDGLLGNMYMQVKARGGGDKNANKIYAEIESNMKIGAEKDDDASNIEVQTKAQLLSNLATQTTQQILSVQTKTSESNKPVQSNLLMETTLQAGKNPSLTTAMEIQQGTGAVSIKTKLMRVDSKTLKMTFSASGSEGKETIKESGEVLITGDKDSCKVALRQQ